MKFHSCNFLQIILLFTLGFFVLQTSMAQDMEVSGNLKIDVDNTIHSPASLHVGADKEVLFGTDTLGGGTKLRWIPSKSAFRAGRLDENGDEAEYWDNPNIGDYSVAMGYNTLATERAAIALGYESLADGWYSTAIGRECKATGRSCTAIGWKTQANGWYSSSLGFNNMSQGNSSVAIGAGNIARSFREIAVGSYCENYEPADSANFYTGSDRAFVVGNGSDDFNRSNALTILKNGSSGFGVSNPNERLEVFGDMVIGGGENDNDGTTEFLKIKSGVQDWFIGGQNFDPDPDDNFINPRFYISTNEDNHEQFIMDINGNVGIGPIVELSNRLEVASDVEIGGGSDNHDAHAEFLQIYGQSDWWIVGVQNEGNVNQSDFFIGQDYLEDAIFHIENEGNVGIGTSEPDYKLHVNGSAGKPGSGSWTVVSDKRLKKEVKPFTDGLEVLQRIDPVTFRYNGEGGIDMEEEFVGVIAQDMKRVAPYMVDNMEYVDTVTNSSTNYLSFDPNALWYVTINAVKEQQAIIEEQKESIEALQTHNEDLENRLDRLEKLVQQLANNNKPISNTEHPSSTSKQQEATIEVIRLSDAHLLQNHPNPFHESTFIEYFIPESVKHAVLQITAINGQLLYSHKIENRGQQKTQIETSQLSPGIYFYSLILDGKMLDTKQMMLTN